MIAPAALPVSFAGHGIPATATTSAPRAAFAGLLEELGAAVSANGGAERSQAMAPGSALTMAQRSALAVKPGLVLDLKPSGALAVARGGDPASGTQPASAQTVESTLAAGTLAPSLSKRSALAPTGREPAGTGVVTFPTGLPEEDPSAAAQQAVQPLPGRGGPAVPVADSRPRRGRQVPQASVADKARVPSGVGAKTPLICVPVALPLPAIVPLNLKPVGGAGGESPERGRKAIACDVAAGQPIAPADTVLEVRLKTKDEPKTDVSPVNSAPPVKTEAGKPENVVNTNATASSDKTSSHEKPDSRAAQASNALQPIRSAAEPERAVLSATAQQAASVPAAAGGAQTSSPHAVVAPAENRTPENAVPRPPEVAARTAYIEEPAERPPNAAQPVRSLSLEFTPDGAGDVRLRLSEHTGEVHISLHSTDTTLGSRLHEGVHDLVGSLSSAGYDAEAWTPGRGQQQNRREPEERGNRRSRGSSGSGDASFVDFFSPVQEVS